MLSKLRGQATPDGGHKNNWSPEASSHAERKCQSDDVTALAGISDSLKIVVYMSLTFWK